jgi:hypothetical protein
VFTNAFYFSKDRKIAEGTYSLKPESVGIKSKSIEYGSVIDCYLNIKDLYKTKIEGTYGLLITESLKARKDVKENIDKHDGAEMTIYDIDQEDPELHSV